MSGVDIDGFWLCGTPADEPPEMIGVKEQRMFLIDANKYHDDVVKFAKAVEANGVDTSLIYAVVLPFLLQQSEVDAEMVVRCRDCRFHKDNLALPDGFKTSIRGFEKCLFFGGIRQTEEDGFCKWGEPKGADDERG